MTATASPSRPTLVGVGDNSTAIWGMSNAERVRRIADKQKLTGGSGVMLANLRYAFDPIWTSYLATRPGTVMLAGGVPVVAHVADDTTRAAMEAAMLADMGAPLPRGLDAIDAADPAGIPNGELRKRERPFVERLIPANVALIERASYAGAYKGVTDVLTKYLWPRWAFHLTRLAASIGLSPNGVTAIGTLLCIVATIAFWHGWFWSGMATGLAFMVLDTVDGKLARCTVTSSAIGNIWDHGIDLVHPPFWWWAWGVGCAAYGRPLGDDVFWAVMGTIVIGYVVQRLIEHAFIVGYGMHIHVWQKFDSDFRLITARRNPNMVILLAALIVGRPDWGIVAVAAWTVISLIVHFVRLMQARATARAGAPITSWLA